MMVNSTQKKSRGIKLMIAVALGLVSAACSESSDTPVGETMDESSNALAKHSVESKVNYATEKPFEQRLGKPVVYQVFTRLFGNTTQPTKPWGTIADNGVGKFNDFTTKALQEIRALGVTHIWYTGILHHAVINDYQNIGISSDDPDVVKGRAGSPYAVKDYYNVNPDLAVEPSKRMQEFESLIERTHAAGLKVIIDIVPNHVARNYQSMAAPEGVVDFGEQDDTSVEYRRDNDFYYIVGESFRVPEKTEQYQPLGGEKHPLADGEFIEVPAKWTGNGSRSAQPSQDDWYETVKINYGVRPDGTYDFPRLPQSYADKSIAEHRAFWEKQQVPASWIKFRDITEFWLSKGVDGFRFDVAELVPVEFWSYLNSHIKTINPDAFLLAEIYQPPLFRDFISIGKMDYLYDKVDFYDTLKLVMQDRAPVSQLLKVQDEYQDIRENLLHFLENHDEQRIASEPFVGDANIGKPALVVSSTISESPMLVYFAQELGEAAKDDPGFGDPTRTTIFDYWAVPSLQRWVNGGQFDGALLTKGEQELRDFYKKVLNISVNHPAMLGSYFSLHDFNLKNSEGYSERAISFIRENRNHRMIVVANFDTKQRQTFELKIPSNVITTWQFSDGNYPLVELLDEENNINMQVKNKIGRIKVDLQPLQSYIFELSE
ncbi:alpha-amylase family protein [Pleionea litopenaei]|uniref:Alpha-amylase family protein n=1 Tax=Pleionea litopenaei TaxID=3070815 RepID=A0AA51RT08_9GAMM|nr:alpha-amylase family protein [Pleionea sp. HL-JVS1]WMS86953.1 alpha-amylase family protein [Pleionea sp. HL-JVS1]